MNAVSHALRRILIRLRHLTHVLYPQKFANAAQHGFGIVNKLLEVNLELALGRNGGEERQNVCLAVQPDQFRELASLEVVCVTEEDLFETCINKGTNHPVRMTNQVDVTRVSKVTLGAAQDLDIKRVRRRFINQHAPAYPRLHQAIKLL